MSERERKSSDSLTGIALEKEQLSLVKSIKMTKHEQLMEYVLFMIEFRRRLQNSKPTKPLSSIDYEWLKIFVQYTQVLGFPAEYVGWFKLARLNKSKGSMMFVLDKTIAYFDREMKSLRGFTE